MPKGIGYPHGSMAGVTITKRPSRRKANMARRTGMQPGFRLSGPSGQARQHNRATVRPDKARKY